MSYTPQGGLLSPLLPLLGETFNVSYSELGLLTSAFGLSAVGMDLIATRFLSRRPLLQTLLQGIIVTGIGLLGCAVALTTLCVAWGMRPARQEATAHPA